MLLRSAGTPPVMAHAPTATKIRQLRRNSRSTWTFSALHTPPSTRPTSQGPQRLMSVSGDRSNSTNSRRSNSRSSMSSSDMWQPKQPASEVVATRSLGSDIDALPRCPRRLQRDGADGAQIVGSPADWHRKSLTLDQDRADGADAHRRVGDGEVGVAETSRCGIDDHPRLQPPAADAEHVLAVDV